MASPDYPQFVGLVGSTATDIAIDSTGNNYDGLARVNWPFGVPNPFEAGEFVVSASATQTDATADVSLRDYNTGTDVTTISGIDLDGTLFRGTFDPDSLDGLADVGVRVNVTDASGTGGATADLQAQVLLLP